MSHTLACIPLLAGFLQSKKPHLTGGAFLTSDQPAGGQSPTTRLPASRRYHV
jgi:hypothetical protein